MRLLVVGAGSTGGYFGGRLAEAGRDVTFLVRPGRAEVLRRDGLRIRSPYGDVVVRPKLVTAGEVGGAYDAVLLAVKAYSLEAAMGDMAAAVGAGTVIVPVLNGMRHMDALVGRFGAGAVAGGVCKVAATVDAEGVVVQLAAFQELAYGELDGSDPARMRGLDGVMQGAGFTARLTGVIRQEMWEKWVMLASLGGITCLMQGAVGAVVAAPGGLAFIGQVLDEVVAAVTAAGVAPRAEVVAAARKTLTQAGSSFASSMFRDMQGGAAIEGEQIVGDLVERGRAAGVAMPMLEVCRARLEVYEAGRG